LQTSYFIDTQETFPADINNENCLFTVPFCVALLWLIQMSSCRRFSERKRISSWSFLPPSGNASGFIDFMTLWNTSR